MPRNLDLTALRSFVAVADTGGVTRAAGFLNLTQSAVSMQLKRLEESIGVELLDRSARTIGLTASGEQLVSYARRMLDLNDEVYGKLTSEEFEGEIKLGVPHDIVYPAIPQVLHRFNAAYPRLRVRLLSSNTQALKTQFNRGEVELILTTESEGSEGRQTLCTRNLVWVGAPGSTVWRARPLPLAFCQSCLFRPRVQRSLDDAGIAWEMAVEGDGDRAIEATVSADLAIHAVLDGTEPPYFDRLPVSTGLPKLDQMQINLYRAELATGAAMDDLTRMLEDAFRPAPIALPQVVTA
ncbi:LysR family transcriptional regulator [Yoonia sp. R2331]|uniref:LysR family transcriptional regulator n=1 Tax=Yoonia sp. R2331 TaxID=3237238 RepID=UPI0034E59722